MSANQMKYVMNMKMRKSISLLHVNPQSHWLIELKGRSTLHEIGSFISLQKSRFGLEIKAAH